MSDPDPKKYQLMGVGPGGGGTTHIDLGDIMRVDSPQSRQFVLLATMIELANYASSIRDTQPEAYKAASATLTAGTLILAKSFGVPGVKAPSVKGLGF
jgi:hypothetical protein